MVPWLRRGVEFIVVAIGEPKKEEANSGAERLDAARLLLPSPRRVEPWELKLATPGSRLAAVLGRLLLLPPALRRTPSKLSVTGLTPTLMLSRLRREKVDLRAS